MIKKGLLKLGAVLLALSLTAFSGNGAFASEQAANSGTSAETVPAAGEEAGAESMGMTDSPAGTDMTAVEDTGSEEGSNFSGMMNFVSSEGKFLYTDGYTYFWDHSLDNDTSGNGQEDSVNLYRISEEKDAKEELLAVFPCPVVSGTIQDYAPIRLLTACGNRIYFWLQDYTDTEGSRSLWWISRDGSEKGSIDTGVSGFYRNQGQISLISDTEIYIYAASFDAETGQMNVNRVVFNAADETIISVAAPESPRFTIKTVNGFSYYLKYQTDAEGTPVIKDNRPALINGLYREDSRTGEEEEICPVDAARLFDFIRQRGASILITENYMYLLTDCLEAIRFSDGEEITVIGEEGPGLLLTEDLIYYVDPETGALSTCGPEGQNKQEWLPCLDEGSISRLAASDQWIYYYITEPGGWGKNCRVSKDAKFLTNNPLGNPYEYTERDIRTEGEWTYAAYNKYAAVIGYTGTESSIVIPEEVGGLPVRAVSSDLWGSDTQWSDVREITFPASVRTIGGIYEPGLEKVNLPAGKIIFRHRDVEHTFWNGGNHLDINYAGTIEEWSAACEYGLAMYMDASIEWNTMESNYSIHCADGDTDYIGYEE